MSFPVPSGPMPGPRAHRPFRRAAHLALVTAALLAAQPAARPAAAQDMREIAGSLVYRQRIALPDDAQVTLRVTDTEGAEVVRDEFPTLGRQVPIDFAFGAPTGDLTLEAGISIGGETAWHAPPVAIPYGETALALAPILLEPLPPVHTWICGGDTLRVRFSGEVALLRSAQGTVELRQTRTASGARYEDPKDPGTWIWNKGQGLTASLGGRALEDCVPATEGGAPEGRTPAPDHASEHTSAPAPDNAPDNAPAQAAADLTARGNEPGWRVDLAGDTVRLRLQDGTDRSLPRSAPEAVPGGQRHALAEGMALTVTAGICRDTMTGMPHPAHATLTWEGTEMTGCAGNPMDLLEGPEWQVEGIDGGGLVDGSHVTILFEDGRAAGAGGCNRWFAEVRLSGESLSFGPAGATMMACPEALMTQEHRFLAALDRVEDFDIDGTGALRLMAGGAPVVTARR